MINISNKNDIRLQSGCIVYRWSQSGLQVLLVSSRNKWTIPSGGVERNLSCADNAKKETFEESGAIGELTHEVGTFSYVKRSGVKQVCKLFAMYCTDVRDDFPERTVRQRRWVSVDTAIAISKHGGPLIERLREQLLAEAEERKVAR